MRVRLEDQDYADDFGGFLQRARCIVIEQGPGIYAVFFAHDLPVSLAQAELRSYLDIWERTRPGGRAAILDDGDNPIAGRAAL
jgi:hypothetical protein